VAINEATKDHISQGAARKVATAVMARPDYYAGQIDQEVKDIIDVDNKDSGGWRDSKGDPLQIEQGKIQEAVLSSSLGIHCKRKQVLNWMQSKAGGHPTAHHGQYFLKQTIMNYEVAKILRTGTPVFQVTPFSPHTQQGGVRANGPARHPNPPPGAAKKSTNRQTRAGEGRIVANPVAPRARKGRLPMHNVSSITPEKRDNRRCPQPPPGEDDDDVQIYDEAMNPAGDLTTLLREVGLKQDSVRGDGNCLPYSVLRSSGRLDSWEEAIKLRMGAISHAKTLPPDTQIELGLRRPGSLRDPMGQYLNHTEEENYWPIAAQEKYGPPHFRLGAAAWMNDNMIYSMATHLGTDIALVKKMEQDQVSNVIRVYHADLPSPVTNVPLTSSAGWETSVRSNGETRQKKSLLQLLEASRNGGRKICVISIDADMTHFEATTEWQEGRP
jgi:hypothetical protein